MNSTWTMQLLAMTAAEAGDAVEPRASLAMVVVVFGTALAAAWVMRAVRAPTILGFLLAGIAIGQSGLGLIDPDTGRQQVQFFAELGLVMLLFTVGLELTPEPLVRMGWRLLLAACLQMGITSLVIGAGLYLLAGLDLAGATVGGLAVSVSSTTIMLKHLADRDQVDSPTGAVVTTVSLLQDMGVILVLILIPLLGMTGRGHASWTTYAGKIGLAVGGLILVIIVARLTIPTLVNLVFRFGGQELMTLFAIVVACTGAWLAGLANWSWPLGSFIGGLLLAQTDVRHQLRAEITPFRDAFNALFFVSIGMLTDLDVFARHPVSFLLAIVGVVAIKTLIASSSVLASGWPLRLAITSGIGLCTISELGYILARDAGRFGIFPADFISGFIVVVVGTMTLGALLVPAGAPISVVVARWLHPDPRLQRIDSTRVGRPVSQNTTHVIIVGYGVNGRNLGRVLRATNIPFTVVEFSRANARTARGDGADVVVGDAARLAILYKAGLKSARALVVSIADRDATRQIVDQAHRARPDLYILARTRYVADLEALYRLGAKQVIPEEFETSIEIFSHVLREFAVPDNLIEQQIMLIRAGHYGMLRGLPTDHGLRVEWLQVLEAALTQTFMLTPDSPACGRTIRDLDLRARTGATIVAVTRRGSPIPSPSPDLGLEDGDVLVLVGTHQQLDAAKALLGPTPEVAAGASA